jgi:phosphate transport system protein
MSVDDRRYTDHISEQFNTALNELRAGLLDMGDLVGLQARLAVDALVGLDREKAQQVIQSDRMVNTLERDLDAACAQILVRQHPVAGDLRLVIAISKIVADLERIGDESTKVARNAIELRNQGRSSHSNAEVQRIGEAVCNMIDESMRAFAQMDAQRAREVIQADGLVDYEYTDAMRELVVQMAQDPRRMSRNMTIMSSLRALERIGDHARNIAWRVDCLAPAPSTPVPGAQVADAAMLVAARN